VDVPVDDQYAVNMIERFCCRDSCIVEKAEPSCPVMFCVVAGRPDQCKTITTIKAVPDSGNCSTDSSEGNIERIPGDIRFRVKPSDSGHCSAALLKPMKVEGIMNTLYDSLRCRFRGSHNYGSRYTGAGNFQPGIAFRVQGVVMRCTAGIRDCDTSTHTGSPGYTGIYPAPEYQVYAG
jgi:hypothetical protein